MLTEYARVPAHWYQQCGGNYYRKELLQLVAPMCDNSKIDSMLLLGDLSARLGDLPVDYRKACVVTQRMTPKTSVISDLSCIPTQSNAFDMVVIAHQFEYVDNPHGLLNEIERVLQPDGELIIAGFNTFRLWQLIELTRRYRYKLDRKEQPIGLNRLRDWLKLLGFEEVSFHCYGICPPVQWFLANFHARPWVRSACDRLPFLANAYVLKAKKRVTGMTPIRPSWKVPGRLVPGGLGTATRQAKEAATQAKKG